ncbi:amino acid permease-domain-containing protein [Xylariomycetidae sp. FL2044]|nr:amino acid permease-domain-containing protein [Xylariomycetidae sp. FL2044]
MRESASKPGAGQPSGSGSSHPQSQSQTGAALLLPTNSLSLSSSSSSSSSSSAYGTFQQDDAGITDDHEAQPHVPLLTPSSGHASAGGGDDGDLVTALESRSLRRGLAQRHLSMLGIAGAIGTGLFLGLGSAIRVAGPLGALLAYATVGLVVCAVQFALGEVSALIPVTGSFVRHADFLVDEALGFAVGWNLVYGNLLAVPGEITAVVVLFGFWDWSSGGDGGVPAPVWIVLFMLLTVGVGLAFVRVFGEIEFVFALVKVGLVILLILLGLAIDVGAVPGTPAIGFAHWRDPGGGGPFVEHPAARGAWGKFLGYWSVMTSAVFSFAGVESLAMAAAETRNPRTAIPAACKRVFVRIVVFYMLAIFVVGLLVSSADPRLRDSSGSAAQSPFVIAASAAGIPAIPSIVNAVVITSAWSASNQSLLAGTRVLYGLALRGQAPRVFLRTTSWGVPYVCTMLFAAGMTLAFMSLSSGALTVFWWLVDLTAAGVLVSWCVILLNHIRLREAMRRQGFKWERLPWGSWWSVYSSYTALGMCVLILLTSGFEVFTIGGWDTSTFVSSYLDVPLVLSAYSMWKYIKKTRVVSLENLPLKAAFEQAERSIDNSDDEEYDEEDGLLPTTKKKPQRVWLKAVSWMWD